MTPNIPALRLFLFLLTPILHCSAEIPPEAKSIIIKRDAAVQKINNNLIDALEKIKVSYTKKGDLDSANSLVSEINKYKKDSNADPETTSRNIDTQATNTAKSRNKSIFDTLVKRRWELKSGDEIVKFRFLPNGDISGSVINSSPFLRNWRIVDERSIKFTWWNGADVVFDMEEDWRKGRANSQKSAGADVEGRTIRAVGSGIVK
jgi:hypothetical protein